MGYRQWVITSTVDVVMVVVVMTSDISLVLDTGYVAGVAMSLSAKPLHTRGYEFLGAGITSPTPYLDM